MNVFWNREQRRLRAGWRLLIQVILFFVLVVVVNGGLGVVLALTAPGVSTPAVLNLLASLGALAAGLLSVWLAGRFLDRRRLGDFGLHLGRNWWVDLGFGLVLGAALMAAIFGVEWALGWVSVAAVFAPPGGGWPLLPLLLIALVSFICVGIYEELIFRGYQLHNLAEGLNFRVLSPRIAVAAAWVLSAAVFGVAHASNPNSTLVSTLNLFVAGLFLGLGFVLTGELAIPIGLHIAWNFFQGNVFGFPVSGTDAGASAVSIVQGGPALLTGGAFGPEAGLVGIGALILGGAVIVAWLRYRYGRVGFCERLAEAPTGAAERAS